MEQAVNPLHIMDLLGSEKVSGKQAASLIRAGWQLRRLQANDSYCSFGAAGIYTHCLYDGERGLRQLTEKAMQGLEVKSEDAMVFDHTWLILDVPFEQKEAVKAAGAEWMSVFSHWACTPSQAADFAQWMKSPTLAVTGVEDLLRLTVPKDEINTAKEVGAFWSYGDGVDGRKHLFCFRAEAGRFERWLNTEAGSAATND